MKNLVVIKPSVVSQIPGFILAFLFCLIAPLWHVFNNGVEDLFGVGLLVSQLIGVGFLLWTVSFFYCIRIYLSPKKLIYKPLTLNGYVKKNFTYDEITFAGIVGLSFVIVRGGHTPRPKEMTTNKHPDYIFVPIGNFSKDSRYQLYEFLESKNITVENKK